VLCLLSASTGLVATKDEVLNVERSFRGVYHLRAGQKPVALDAAMLPAASKGTMTCMHDSQCSHEVPCVGRGSIGYLSMLVADANTSVDPQGTVRQFFMSLAAHARWRGVA
jgi:hypothetical protein